MKSDNFATLTSSSPEAYTILEHYLNGNYAAFQKCLHTIQKMLKYDLFFGEHRWLANPEKSVFSQIRSRALIQHVQTYSQISIKEISQEFQETEA